MRTVLLLLGVPVFQGGETEARIPRQSVQALGNGREIGLGQELVLSLDPDAHAQDRQLVGFQTVPPVGASVKGVSHCLSETQKKTKDRGV